MAKRRPLWPLLFFVASVGLLYAELRHEALRNFRISFAPTHGQTLADVHDLCGDRVETGSPTVYGGESLGFRPVFLRHGDHFFRTTCEVGAKRHCFWFVPSERYRELTGKRLSEDTWVVAGRNEEMVDVAD